MEENNQNKKEEEKKSIFKTVFSNNSVVFLWELFKIALIALVIVAPIRYFLFQPFIVSGASMVPNFKNGDYLIVDEISLRFSSLQRGDVIVFNFPKNTKERFIKRVIGLPGETVKITDGQVSVIKDNKTSILEEKYLPADLKTYPNETVTLKSDEFFVMGDNRTQSYDSRMWGTVPRANIIGKVFLRIFPLSALSEFSKQAY